jgi:hypothetical protein
VALHYLFSGKFGESFTYTFPLFFSGKYGKEEEIIEELEITK